MVTSKLSSRLGESPNTFRRSLGAIRFQTARIYYRLRKIGGGPDFLDEIDFWEGVLRQQPTAMFDRVIQKAAFPPELRMCAELLRQEGGGIPKLLELGSGPVSILASGVEEGLFTVVAIDPLAGAYRHLFDMYGLSYPIQPVKGRGETIANQFTAGEFDLVYSSNTLDHCVSPGQCMEQMYKVLRQGGFLMLEGFVKEGSQGNWLGLHQHDLFIEEGCLIHVDRRGRRTNLTASKSLTCVTERTEKFANRGILTPGYDVPEDLPLNAPWDWRLRDWYTLVFRKD